MLIRDKCCSRCHRWPDYSVRFTLAHSLYIPGYSVFSPALTGTAGILFPSPRLLVVHPGLWRSGNPHSGSDSAGSAAVASRIRVTGAQRYRHQSDLTDRCVYGLRVAGIFQLPLTPQLFFPRRFTFGFCDFLRVFLHLLFCLSRPGVATTTVLRRRTTGVNSPVDSGAGIFATGWRLRAGLGAHSSVTFW